MVGYVVGRGMMEEVLGTLNWIRTLASATLETRDLDNVWSALSDIIINADMAIDAALPTPPSQEQQHD